MMKTNAMRLLEQRKIPYRATEYAAAGEFHSAEEVAGLLGAPPERVFKTLVVLRETGGGGKPLLVMIPAAGQLDLRLLAKEVGEKKLRMATQREAEELTGLQVGGISALTLLQRGFDVVIDGRARELDKIHISAGVRGVDLELAVADLAQITRARLVRATASEGGDKLEGA